MRPLDLYTEKQAGDSAADRAASQTLFREANSLELQARLKQPQVLSVQDKTSLVTASMLVGSPLMLFGLGATFAMCDEVDRRRSSEADVSLAHQQERTMAFVALDRDRQMKPLELRAHLPIMPTELVADGLQPNKKPRKLNEKEVSRQAVFSDRQGNRRAAFPAANKHWLEASKLVKRKLSLMDMIERLNDGRNYNAICKISAQIELLDKALKRLGC